MMLRQRVLADQQRRRGADLWRQPQAWESAPGQRIIAAGRTLINFAGNDYLGLAQEPRLAQSLARAAQQYGVGSGASRLVSGTHPEHLQVEEELAQWLGRPQALFFGSGYLLNLALASVFLERGDRVVCDRLNHASLVDGARLSRAEVRRYPHADVAAAERQLAGAMGATLLVSDGVFSMDGDCAPVAALQQLSERHGALLAIDDAHGLGVLGSNGLGCFDAAGVMPADDTLLLGTCGKALGTAGAFVAGDALWIEQLRQSARSWIYSTAPPPAVAAATRTALGILRSEPERRRRLSQLIAYFRQCAAQLGLPLCASHSAIQPLIVGASGAALALARDLEQRGLWVVAMREPTVPHGTARLRITLSAGHQRSDVDQLLEALSELWPRFAPQDQLTQFKTQQGQQR